MKLEDRISNWIKKKVQEARAEGVVVGLSGGVDSSVVACLAKMALKEKVLGLIMPCHSESLDEHYASLMAKRFSIRTERIVLDLVYDRLLEILPSSRNRKLALANLKPRLRMTTLYYFANHLNYLVAGTGNKSEILIGYFTKYGDGGCDILPLGDLLKTRVRELAVSLGIPEEIIKRTPSAGLWKEQTDEGEIGLSYSDLDRIILAIESGKTDSMAPRTVARVKELKKRSEHKRSPVPVFIEGSGLNI
jgi:NAD+ synthase